MLKQWVVAAAAAALAGCGATSREEARDKAADASCDRVEACNEFGGNNPYANRDDCDVKVTAFWNGAWPAEDCDEQVSSDGLDGCLEAIRGYQCGNGADLLNILANRCTKERVCSGD
ncbi:MAG TPA: DUF6184 family natural product biosynthesis lipoprotein [Myxococcaceae bacterium]|nr:DUF6184 family natural product biosynthesis lipoprotein [Myxococcaceae bacterium]